MVTKIKNNMILIVLLNLLFMKCSTMDKSNPNTVALLFENYSKEMELPTEFFSINTHVITDSIFLDEELLLQPKQSQKITGNVFSFLCDLDLINGWNLWKDDDLNLYPNKVEEFVELRKKELSLFCLGEVSLSEEFQSFLILSIDGVDNEYNLIRNLYLMNVKNNKCESLTRVASYTCFNGECNYIYTERSANNLFIQKEVEVSSNVIVVEKSEKETSRIKFMYDKKGMLKML
jgi:hypothetical protein